MGGSNPKELRALGAPDNRRIKHLRGLHAKVYLSNKGLITNSANASNNGIGFFGSLHDLSKTDAVDGSSQFVALTATSLAHDAEQEPSTASVLDKSCGDPE